MVAHRPYRRRLGILKHRILIIKPRPTAENISRLDGAFGRGRRLLSAQNSLRCYRAAAVGVEGQITACAVMDNRSAVCHPSVIDAADHIASFQIDPAVKGSAFYGSAVIDYSTVKYAAENDDGTDFGAGGRTEALYRSGSPVEDSLDAGIRAASGA